MRKKFYPRSSMAMNYRIVLLITLMVVAAMLGACSKKQEVITEPVIEIALPQPEFIQRYKEITMTEDEIRDLAAIIYLEARNQTFEGQQAVAEVVLNRVIANNFPDTVHDVLHQGAGTNTPQFATISLIDKADPKQEQYEAINAALFGPSILDADVVYFSRGGENNRTWGTIGDHVFCYQYNWE